MKRIILLILPMFVALMAIAQADEEDKTQGPVENGPVIININGHSLNQYDVNRKEIRAIEIKEENTESIENQEDIGVSLNNAEYGRSAMSGLEGQKNEELSREEANEKEVEKLRDNLRIYPIPAINNLNIDLGDDLSADLTVMNIIGQKVYQKKLEKEELIRIPVSDFAPGTYFVVIEIHGKIITKRVQIH